MELITQAKLIAIRQGLYTMYVFKDLDNNQYIMCTRLPDWKVPDFEINDEGFLKYQFVKAGDIYLNPNTGESCTYKYDNVYFLNFVKRSEITNDNIIL